MSGFIRLVATILDSVAIKMTLITVTAYWCVPDSFVLASLGEAPSRVGTVSCEAGGPGWFPRQPQAGRDWPGGYCISYLSHLFSLMI